MGKLLRCSLFFVALTGFFVNRATASHMMGADIWYTYVSPNQYEVTLTFYKDCNGFVDMGPTITIGASSVSCGQTLSSITLDAVVMDNEVSPLCPSQLSQSSCNGGTLPGVLQYVYKGIVTLPAQCNDWIIYYEDCCRNIAITNIGTPDSYGWRVEATIDNTGGLVNSSPSFTSLPVPYVCADQPYFYNHGGFDLDGDSLVYNLISPMDWLSAAPIPYLAPFSTTYPLSTASGTVGFDPTSGQVSFTATGTQVTVVVVRVDEYRDGELVGSSMRDIQVVVLNCLNTPPAITGNPTNVQGGFATGPTTFEVCPGQVLEFDFVASDPDAADSLFITTNLATVLPGATITMSGVNPVNGSFYWQPSGIDTGFHSFTLTVKDNFCPISGQNVFSYQIYVLSGTSAGPDITLCGTQTAQLQATGGTDFIWSPATALSGTNISNPISTTTSNITYTVSSNLTSGCDNSDEVVVFYVPDFTFTASTGDTICVGQSLPLSATASGPGTPFSYVWTPAGGLSASNIADPVASPTVTTTYQLSITSAEGCNKTADVPVFIAGVTPQFTIDSVEPVCAGAPVQLQAVVGGSTADCTPVYTTGCGVSDQIDLFTFNTLYHFDNVCNGFYNYFPSTTGFTTTVDAGSTYTTTMQANPAWGQGFRVWIDYNHNGDFGDPGEDVYNSGVSGTQLFTGSVLIPVSATPGPTRLRVMCRYATLPTPMDYCGTSFSYGETQDYDIFINGPSGASSLTYEWTPAGSLNDATVANPVATPVQTTTYQITVSYNGFCPKTDSVVVTMIPAVSSFLGDTTVCVNNPVMLNPGNPVTDFAWSASPGGLVSTVDQNPTVTPLVTSTYYYSGMDLLGCISDSFVVYVTPLPAVGLMPTQDTVVCFGQSISLTVTGNYDTFLWNADSTLSGTNTASVTASPVVDNTYYVNVSNADGCVSADTISVTVLPFMIPETIADTSICPGTAAILSM
ncbi:MAG TPA: GEVED domain-containing protein, partial [Chitinophagales bacterium]|nr:GEVED domain-containing protein [Chitinophagales bacterium]